MSSLMGDFIDFEEIRNQDYRQALNRTHEFNLMLVGNTGCGKSTLVKSLFQGKIKPEESVEGPKLNVYTELLTENKIQLRLRCIETSGYDVHNVAEYKKYIDEQLKSYFRAQHREASWKIEDTRIHCCLYLIPPYGKMALRKEDIDCMRGLHENVNLVPVIVRADSINSEQVAKFKENIINDLERNRIKYFRFHFDPREDEELSKLVKIESERFPFAVVAADGPTTQGSKSRWIRFTNAGEIDIWDSSKSDFQALGKLLIRYCILNLIDSTHKDHYTKFKNEVLREARESNGDNLRAIGLRENEIRLVMFYIRGGHIHHTKLRSKMELQLQALRNRRQTLKLSLQSTG